MKILAFIIEGFKSSTIQFFKEALSDHDVIFFSSNYQYYQYDEIKNEFKMQGINLEYPAFYYNYDTSLKDVFHALPDGWNPDIVMVFNIEYNIIPFDIESYPCPVIGILIDWFVNFSTLKEIVKRFDYIFVGDIEGYNLFHTSGFNRIDYMPIHGYSPQFHKRLDNVENIYDITFIGNFNHNIHQERSLWLYRLSKLSNKYKVNIVTDVYDADYIMVLNQSKITFNYTVTGSMNMRTYEAAACGSLLLTESANNEIRDYFTDREECVLYDENNLEELIDYYLQNDYERNRIIENAYNRVQQYTYKIFMENILEKIKNTDFNKYKRDVLNTKEHMIVNAKHIYITTYPFSSYIRAKLEQEIPDVEILNILGLLYLALSEISPYEELKQGIYEKSLQYILQATDKKPNHPILNYNLGHIYKILNDMPKAIDAWEKCVEILEDDKNYELSELIYPYRYNSFSSMWEKNEYENIKNPIKLIDTRQNILLSKCLECLGSVYINSNDLIKAEKKLKKALPFSSEAHITMSLIGELYYNKGDFDDATEMFKRSLKHMPFHVSAWYCLLTALTTKERYKECINFCIELYKIFEGIPKYKECKEKIDYFYDNASEQIFNLIEAQIIDNLLDNASQNINFMLDIQINNLECLFYKGIIDLKLKNNGTSIMNAIESGFPITQAIVVLNKLFPSIKTSYTVLGDPLTSINKNILIPPYFTEGAENPDIHVQILEKEINSLKGKLNIGYIVNTDIDHNELIQFDILWVTDMKIKKYLKDKGFYKDIFTVPLYIDTSIFNEYEYKIEITDKKDFNFLYIIENSYFGSVEKILKLYFEQVTENDNISLVIGCLKDQHDKTTEFLQNFCSEYENVPDIILLDITYEMLPSLFRSADVFLWDKNHTSFLTLAAAGTKTPILTPGGLLNLESNNLNPEFNIKNIYDIYYQTIETVNINHNYIETTNNQKIKGDFSHKFSLYILQKELNKINLT